MARADRRIAVRSACGRVGEGVASLVPLAEREEESISSNGKMAGEKMPSCNT